MVFPVITLLKKSNNNLSQLYSNELKAINIMVEPLILLNTKNIPKNQLKSKDEIGKMLKGGEAGEGFAVVSDEIQKLAKNSEGTSSKTSVIAEVANNITKETSKKKFFPQIHLNSCYN